jgi:hypothetical protein
MGKEDWRQKVRIQKAEVRRQEAGGRRQEAEVTELPRTPNGEP